MALITVPVINGLEEIIKQQAFNDAVAVAVAAALAAQQAPATTSEPVVEEPIVTEE